MAVGRSVEVVIEEVAGRLAELDALLSPDVLTEGEVAEAAVGLERLRSMLEARCARAASLVEAGQVWVADGARSATAWLAWRTHLPAGRLRRSAGCGRALRAMPATEAAFVAGAVGVEHVEHLARARELAPEAFAAGGEELLVREAGQLLFAQWVKAVAYWCQLAAPDTVEDRARRQHQDRRAHCSRTVFAAVALDAQLDTIGGEIVARELDRLYQELFAQDLADARQRLGIQDPPLHELGRTPAQRRADALVLMARRSAAKPPGAVEPRVLLHVLAGIASVERMCELSNGTVVTPGQVLPLLTMADVERVVFASPSKVIDIGHRRRFFDGATRTAVQLRDRCCTHPTCTVPFDQCEIDHIQPAAEGGPTTQDNGRCRCTYHHRRARDS